MSAVSDRTHNRRTGKRLSEAKQLLARVSTVVVIAFLVFAPVFAGDSAPATVNRTPGQPIPVIDAEAGPCSVEFTVTDIAGRGLYAARIKVHIEYGLFGLRQLDLEVATNADGMARFEALPESTDGALFFRASKGPMRGFAFYSPDEECTGKHTIVLTEGSPVAPFAFIRSHPPQEIRVARENHRTHIAAISVPVTAVANFTITSDRCPMPAQPRCQP